MKRQPYQHCTFVSQYKSKRYGNACCEPAQGSHSQAWQPQHAQSRLWEWTLLPFFSTTAVSIPHPPPPESCSRPFRWQMHSSASITSRKSSRATVTDSAHQSKLRLWLKVQVNTIASPGERFSSTEFAKQGSSQASPSLGIFTVSSPHYWVQLKANMSLYSTVVLHLQKKLEKLQNKSNDKQLYLPSSSGIINRQKAHKYGKVQEIGTKLKEED